MNWHTNASNLIQSNHPEMGQTWTKTNEESCVHQIKQNDEYPIMSPLNCFLLIPICYSDAESRHCVSSYSQMLFLSNICHYTESQEKMFCFLWWDPSKPLSQQFSNIKYSIINHGHYITHYNQWLDYFITGSL